MYAVPGLKSHVFVGPFTAPKTACASEEDDDIVCLEDEDVKVLEPNKEKDDEEPVIEKKKEDKKDSLLKRRLLGEIPLLVERNETEDNVDVFETEFSEVNQAKSLKRIMSREVSGNTEDLSDLKPSEYGKLVQRQSERNLKSSSLVDILFRVADEERKYSGHIEPSGKVILPHPNHKEREVLCSNVENARLWLESHFQTVEKEDFDDEDVLFDDPEPLPSEPPTVKTPPPILKRIKTPLLPSGKSNKKIALFVQMRQQKDEAQLFYELGHTAFKKFFNKNVTRAKILDKALEEINILQAEGREMELSKQNLLKRRTKLFELFTKSLNGLPVAKKKAAVIELKELLRKDKERKEAGSKGPEPVTASNVPPSTSSKKIARSQSQNKEPAQQASSGPTPYTDATGINTLRPDGTVLRPMNAFMLWAKDRRSPLLAQGLGISQVSQVSLYFLFLTCYYCTLSRFCPTTGKQ